MDYELLAGVAFGMITVYTFFWNQGRARKSDEEALNAKIQDENEKQNKATETNNDQQHKRISGIVEDSKHVQHTLGYDKGYREGYKDGKAEIRAQLKQG